MKELWKKEREEKKQQREQEKIRKAEEKLKREAERKRKAEEKELEKKWRAEQREAAKKRKTELQQKQAAKREKRTRIGKQQVSAADDGLKSAEISSNECAACLGAYEEDIVDGVLEKNGFSAPTWKPVGNGCIAPASLLMKMAYKVTQSITPAITLHQPVLLQGQQVYVAAPVSTVGNMLPSATPTSPSTPNTNPFYIYVCHICKVTFS